MFIFVNIRLGQNRSFYKKTTTMLNQSIKLCISVLTALIAIGCATINVPPSSSHNLENISDSCLQNQITLLEEQLATERTISGIALIVLLVGLGALIATNQRRTKRHINKLSRRMKDAIRSKIAELEVQKEQLEITNNRIAESITYAERIQHSILPAPELLNNYPIEESFIFFSPLDIVSGDFYWFAPMGDNLLVCCADCTGHGVPGGFMSMIASTILSDICSKAKNDISPAEILERLDERLIKTLAQNTDEESAAAKDGLDIAIISINLKTKLVTSSAARRPIIIFRDQDIITLKGTKRSIGDTDPTFHQRSFENTYTQLHTGDVIYMFSDGYTDQLGGDTDDKIKIKRVKAMLRGIHNDDMDEQSLTVQEFFTQWKGDNAQIDDVLFLGIKL